MSIASDTAIAALDHDDTETSLLLPVLALIAALAGWIAATLVWGFSGFISGADVAVLLAFAFILRATRI